MCVWREGLCFHGEITSCLPVLSAMHMSLHSVLWMVLGGLATTGPTSPRGVGTSLRSAWVSQAQSADSWQSWDLKLLGSKPKARAPHGGDSLSIHTVDVRGRHFLLKHSRCSKKGVWRRWRKWNHLRGVENPQPRSIMVL